MVLRYDPRDRGDDLVDRIEVVRGDVRPGAVLLNDGEQSFVLVVRVDVLEHTWWRNRREDSRQLVLVSAHVWMIALL